MAAQWPSAVSTASNLYTTVNLLTTTLAGNINNAVTTIALTSTTGFPTAGAVTIDNEVIFYTGVSGGNLTGCTRGSDGTTAASHNAGVPVGATLVAYHINAGNAEIIAIEQNLSDRFGTGTDIVVPNTRTFTLAKTTNQLILGATRTLTLTAPTPATSSRTVTIPDLVGDYDLVGTIGTQTIGGAKTLSSALTINPASNQLVLGVTRTVTVTAPTPASTSRTVTIPDLVGDYSLIGDIGTQTIGGSKTFSSALTINPASNQLVLGVTRTVTVTAPTPGVSSRTWTIPDISADGTFAALEGTQTFSGAKTFSADMTISGNHALIINDAAGTPKAVTVKTPAALTENWTFTLPPTNGNNGEFLTTDGNGVTTWQAPAGSGTVNSGTAGRLSLYASTTTAVSDTYVQNSQNIHVLLEAQASRSAGLDLTIPNPGNAVTTGNFLIDSDTNARTIASTYTFSGGSIKLTNTNKAIISAAPIATADRTYTIPDISGNGTFALLEGTQTFSGAKTFSSTLTMSGATIAMGSQKITGLAAGSVAGDALRYEQLLSGDVTLAGNLIFNPTTNGVKGTTTNDNPAAGVVGQVVTAGTSSTLATTNTWKDITSVSLTAGDWLVSVCYATVVQGTATTFMDVGVSTTSGNSATGLTFGINQQEASAANPIAFSIPPQRFSLASTTSVFLKWKANYTGTAPQGQGGLVAVRIR